MDSWQPRHAVVPFVWTSTFLYTSLFHISFPDRYNRWIAFASIVVPACAAFSTSTNLFPDAFAEETYLRFVIIFLAHMSFLLILKRQSRNGEKLHKDLQISIKNPWLRGYKLLFNARGIGATWELPYLWRSQKSRLELQEKDQGKDEISAQISQTSQKWRALFIRSVSLTLKFLALCFYYEYLNLAKYLKPKPSDFTLEKESIIRRAFAQSFFSSSSTPITQRELFIRTWSVFDMIIPEYLALSAYHDFFSLLFVSAGFDDSAEWPSLFGPVSEAYTIRQYWSRFWHRLVYKSFSAHAAEILDGIGLRKRTLASRLLQNWLVFALSALMHGIVSWKMGNRCAFSGNLVWWVMQPFAFVLEAVVAYLWRTWRRSTQKRNTRAIVIFERTVGYVWVLAWMFWSVPKGTFPLIYCGRK